MANRLSEPETSLSTQIREVRLVDAYCLTFRSKIFHLYRDVTITGEGLQNFSLCSRSWTFSKEESLSCRPAVTRGVGFLGPFRRTIPFSRLYAFKRQLNWSGPSNKTR